MKFCFRVGKTDSIDTAFEGLRTPELLHYLETAGAGTRMHLVVRPRPGFNIEAKRNYFHGPLLDWIVSSLREKGIPATKEAMRKELVKKFVGTDEEGKPLSIATYIEAMVEGDPRDPEEKYGDLLSDVRIWCMDVLQSEPPRPDQVDLGEECDQCAMPETI